MPKKCPPGVICIENVTILVIFIILAGLLLFDPPPPPEPPAVPAVPADPLTPVPPLPPPDDVIPKPLESNQQDAAPPPAPTTIG